MGLGSYVVAPTGLVCLHQHGERVLLQLWHFRQHVKYDVSRRVQKCGKYNLLPNVCLRSRTDDFDGQYLMPQKAKDGP